MNVAITEGIEIRVKAFFRPDLSQIEQSSLFYNYEIYIENHNPFSVQLLRRHWYIFDSLEEISLVNGEGVIGEQPILKPNESFSYKSGCEVFSDVAYMKGYYVFQNLITGQLFYVTIPKFELIFPPKLS